MELTYDGVQWGTQMLGRLLTEEFPGVTELRAHAAVARLEEILEAFIIHLPADVPAAAVRTRIPVEAEGVDADGMALYCLLHVVNGRLAELELYRADGEVIHTIPPVTAWKIDSAGGRIGGP